MILPRGVSALAVAAALGGAGGCGGGSSTADADTGDRPLLPVCPMPSTLFTVTLDGTRVSLGDGSSLGIILGFQGFQFANIGIATSEALPSPAAVESLVMVPDRIDRSVKVPHVRTVRGAGGWETDAVIVYFNDVPLADLIGRDGSIELRVTGTTCLARATAQVKLTSGGFQGADGGVDGEGDTGPDSGGG